MGVFKHLSDVPERYRLHRYATDYEGRDVWTEFCETHQYAQGSSERYQEAVDRTGEHWQAHMKQRERHHALATPEDVETWCRTLVDGKALSTAYNYWVHVRQFYAWLQWHTEHPHVYDPVLIAVTTGSAAGQIWEQKLQKWNSARERYQENND
jgi:hypothetical protein